MTATLVQHGITIEQQSAPPDDKPDAFRFVASCLCGHQSKPAPRVDAVQAGRDHIADSPEQRLDDVERARQAGYDAGYEDGMTVIVERRHDATLLPIEDVAERMGFTRDEHGRRLVMHLAVDEMGRGLLSPLQLGGRLLWRRQQLDDWLQDCNPRGYLRSLGAGLITLAAHDNRPSPRPVPADGPVSCEPWCVYGDGHAPRFREDQTCMGEPLRVELTLEPPLDPDPDETGGPECVDVSARRNNATGVETVNVLRLSTDTEVNLTPAEARQLVEALQLVLGQLDQARAAR